MTGIKEVAEAAGVSTATVSRVLTNGQHVRPEVRQRVMAAVESLQYRPNLVARSLRSQHSKTLGLIVSDIRNPFFTSLSRAVEDTAYASGYSIFLCNTDEDSDKERIYLQLMRDTNVAGVIISPTSSLQSDHFRWHLDIPVVVVDRAMPDLEVDTIVLDNTASAHRLTSHLIERGFQRIGALFGENTSTGRLRYQGFVQALNEHQLPVVPELVRSISPRVASGYQATADLLALDPPPTAILTSNSLTLEGALMAIRDRQLRIPEDVALVGFDETPWTALVQPAITLIAQPTYDIGKTAAEMLLRRIADPKRPVRQITLYGKLMDRGSC